jgi:hypothetical protein
VDLLRNVNPKPKPRGRQTMWWTDLHGNPTDAYGRPLDENPAPMDDGASA